VKAHEHVHEMDVHKCVQIGDDEFQSLDKFVKDMGLVPVTKRQTKIGGYTVLLMTNGEVIKCFVNKFYCRTNPLLERWKIERSSRGARAEIIFARDLFTIYQR
jgi:hypothetical protein